MRGGRAALALLGVCLLGAWLGVANEAPEMEDQLITTYRNVPVAFFVRAVDPDIDPLHPNAHPLTFVLIDGPYSGTLTGNFSRVSYEGPHTAYVQLRYEPAADFVGTDYLTIDVTDPFGLTASGTTTIQIEVRPRSEGALSGSVYGSLSYDVQSESVTVFRNRVTEAYRVGPVTLQAVADWRMFEHPSAAIDESRVWFDALRFQADARFDQTFLNAMIVLEPTPAAALPVATDYFDYALMTTRFKLFDVSFAHTFYLDDDAANSYQSFVGRGRVGAVTYSATTILAMGAACGISFSSQEVDAEWRSCATRFAVAVTLTEAGFAEATARIDDYGLPGLTWTGGGLYVDLTFTYGLDEKSVTPSLVLKTTWIDCIRLYAQIAATDATTVDGALLYGLRIRHALGAVKLESATSFSATKNATMTGQVDYFELIRISGPMIACCGVPGTWSVATYFQDDHPSLLGWGMTTVKTTVHVGSNTALSLEGVFRTGGFGDPKLELAFGWRVRW